MGTRENNSFRPHDLEHFHSRSYERASMGAQGLEDLESLLSYCMGCSRSVQGSGSGPGAGTAHQWKAVSLLHGALQYKGFEFISSSFCVRRGMLWVWCVVCRD